jgi:hypothetical protein
MKKLILIVCILSSGLQLTAQDIKLLDAYLRGNDQATRYVAVMNDNTIWWFAPGQAWQKSSTEGLPSAYEVKFLSCYSHKDGSTRYTIVLSDNSIWWFAPGQTWEKSSVDGLPSGYSIKDFNAYSKAEGTRYVALLGDNTIWWFAPGQTWQKSSIEGLGK